MKIALIFLSIILPLLANAQTLDLRNTKSSPTFSSETINGLITNNPLYAGLGESTFSNGFCIKAPFPITAVTHCFGYTNDTLGETVGQLQISANGINNIMALTQLNPVAFSALTFRNKDRHLADPTLPVEHGAVGCLTDADTINQGFCFLEASRHPNDQITYAQPPELDLFQTGSADPTGGTAYTCSTTLNSTSLVCTGNVTATAGQWIVGQGGPTATGIPMTTRVVSGGGTTTIVMSLPATKTVSSETVSIQSPVGDQRRVFVARNSAYDLGHSNIEFHNLVAYPFVTFDRLNSRVGIGQPNPTKKLEVNGDILVTGNIYASTVGAGFVLQTNGSGENPATGTTYTSAAGLQLLDIDLNGATIATHTVVLPPNAIAGQTFSISCTGTISTLTILPGTGNVLRGGSLVTSCQNGTFIKFHRSVNTVWYPG